jgi:hypothetical protein
VPVTCDWNGPFAGLMEKIMSKSTTPPTDVVRELRDDELETVNGGYSFFQDVMVESLKPSAPRLATNYTAININYTS